MAISDNVVVNVSIANASSPTVIGLNTGVLVGYHNVYPDRIRVYSVATMLTQMIADGFSVKSALYKAATAYCAAPSAPSLCAIGRRANAFTKTLKLTCVDGTVGDAYAVTVVGSDNVSHALAYTNVIAPGAAIPAFLTVIMIPLSYSIANGLAFGITSHAALKLVRGQARPGDWLVYLLAALCVLRFIYLAG